MLEGEFTVQAGGRADAFQVTAEIRAEERVVAFWGPSGAGKSITLRTLAGLLRPLRGTLEQDGRVLFDTHTGVWVPPQERQVGYVPQDSGLFGFCDVARNVAFGLGPTAMRHHADEVREALRQVGIEHLASRRPSRLSGGERQRVALARALIMKPRLLLLDEPFASLDPRSRASLRDVVRDVVTHGNYQTVLVTHDEKDVSALADQVIAFRRGRTISSVRGSLSPADGLSVVG